MRRLRYPLVLLVALELAVWESFLVAARPFGVTVPLAAVLALVGNLVVGRAGARELGRPLGAALPGFAWIATALLLGTSGPGGDAVVTSGWRGVGFLVAGSAAAVAAVALAGTGENGATPEAESRR
ncbi:MAG TPA: DUF6113 family protein [Mycobacteriales bacterium]|nr:DUF6113 family protein [Mycobacteriales bacterium]